MSYKVLAACVLAKNQQGLIQYVYESGVIQWLSEEQAAHFVEEGLVEEIGGGDPDDPPSDEKPAKVATKAILVDWLDEHGQYDRDELEAQTKDQLWELIDATEI